MPDKPNEAGSAAGEGGSAVDPFEGWTDDEKSEWNANEKFRKRHTEEVAEALFDRLFNEPAGGATVKPEGEGEPAPAPANAGGAPATPASTGREPWFERRLFAPKSKEGAAK